MSQSAIGISHYRIDKNAPECYNIRSTEITQNTEVFTMQWISKLIERSGRNNHVVKCACILICTLMVAGLFGCSKLGFILAGLVALVMVANYGRLWEIVGIPPDPCSESVAVTEHPDVIEEIARS